MYQSLILGNVDLQKDFEKVESGYQSLILGNVAKYFYGHEVSEYGYQSLILGNVVSAEDILYSRLLGINP